MKAIKVGARHTMRVVPDASQFASALGNEGVDVVSTPALIGFLENAAHQLIQPCYDAGETSVGTVVNVRHLAAARAGAPVVCSAELTGVDGLRHRFAVEARQEGRVVMSGEHERAVIHLSRFLGKTATASEDRS